jgi:hypothetical protein
MESARQTIMDNIDSGKSTLLIAPNRSGKSYMFNRLLLDVQKTRRAISIAGEEFNEVRTAKGLFSVILFNQMKSQGTIDTAEFLSMTRSSTTDELLKMIDLSVIILNEAQGMIPSAFHRLKDKGIILVGNVPGYKRIVKPFLRVVFSKQIFIKTIVPKNYDLILRVIFGDKYKEQLSAIYDRYNINI